MIHYRSFGAARAPRRRSPSASTASPQTATLCYESPAPLRSATRHRLTPVLLGANAGARLFVALASPVRSDSRVFVVPAAATARKGLRDRVDDFTMSRAPNRAVSRSRRRHGRCSAVRASCSSARAGGRASRATSTIARIAPDGRSQLVGWCALDNGWRRGARGRSPSVRRSRRSSCSRSGRSCSTRRQALAAPPARPVRRAAADVPAGAGLDDARRPRLGGGDSLDGALGARAFAQRVDSRRRTTSSSASRSQDALTPIAERMDSEDVGQVALVAALHTRTGGNMAEVLERVADSVRERGELRRELRSLTAQARLSRYVVTALPLVVGLVHHDHQPRLREAAVRNDVRHRRCSSSRSAWSRLGSSLDARRSPTSRHEGDDAAVRTRSPDPRRRRRSAGPSASAPAREDVRAAAADRLLRLRGHGRGDRSSP